MVRDIRRHAVHHKQRVCFDLMCDAGAGRAEAKFEGGGRRGEAVQGKRTDQREGESAEERGGAGARGRRQH